MPETSNKVASVTYLKVTVNHYEPIPPEEVAKEVQFDLHWIWPGTDVEAISHMDPRA